jgi:pyridoxal phosphate enzyme (YggS family)
MSSIKDNINTINERIAQAAAEAGRARGSVRLVAVSKTKPPGLVAEALAAGHTRFGENYVQEARNKIEELSDRAAEWHFIGHLQTNKAKYVVKLFDLIHSVDSTRLASAINKEAAKIDKVQNILIQVNVSGEETKSGSAPEETLKLVRHVSAMDHLALKGLMTMPPFFDDPDRARPFFAELRRIRDTVRDGEPKVGALDELSMGMTGDFEAAIAEGATLVRVGTAIFGGRG